MPVRRASRAKAASENGKQDLAGMAEGARDLADRVQDIAASSAPELSDAERLQAFAERLDRFERGIRIALGQPHPAVVKLHAIAALSGEARELQQRYIDLSGIVEDAHRLINTVGDDALEIAAEREVPVLMERLAAAGVLIPA